MAWLGELLVEASCSVDVLSFVEAASCFTGTTAVDTEEEGKHRGRKDATPVPFDLEKAKQRKKEKQDEREEKIAGEREGEKQGQGAEGMEGLIVSAVGSVEGKRERERPLTEVAAVALSGDSHASEELSEQLAPFNPGS
uniref:Uncharacterized protein n=1 Tax=Chromera velia CCMP2878 TaxID=1169474 RepID=A0A0G4HVK0_9ALVE|eukprot:Cvel_8876.t1-p1 / transcript=Cvel_8876.t1 / gene=Cvel_8876 / organism=Chromera_velia_CCMP2878 / gene_product=hypothetical protein / transcript_product=hypothetical protein / location=Cvel_scaffold499:37320-39605(+) / protein_length=138 / sequence_SO=supercontig / SO=protein_coding / is_pseudo=false